MKAGRIPYFYIIGWSQLNRWYVGCRYAKGCHPSDLMVTYFTSSKKYVHPFIKQHGLPDVVWTFPRKTAEDAKAGELRIMNEFHNFLPDPRWLNKNKGGCVSFDDEVRAKISQANKLRTGRVVTDQQRTKISSSLTGRKLPQSTIEKMTASRRERENKYEYKGGLYSINEIMTFTDLPRDTVYSRLRGGCSVEIALQSKSNYKRRNCL